MAVGAALALDGDGAQSGSAMAGRFHGRDNSYITLKIYGGKDNLESSSRNLTPVRRDVGRRDFSWIAD
jgi:hypothetical protein